LLIYVRELVENYINKKKVKLDNILKYTTLAVNKIYKKLFLISLSVFMLNKELFFKLVRKTDEDQQEFFDEASKIYLGMVN